MACGDFMIYTVTLNPALDYHLNIDGLRVGETNRSVSQELYYGGKGINVSTVLMNLGIPSTVFGFIAGFTGQQLEKSLRETGLITDFIEVSGGLTRINVKLKALQETEINADGPAVSDGDIEQLKEKLKCLQTGDVLVLAGSVPKSVGVGVYAELMHTVGHGVKVVVDATGEALLKTLPLNPYLIKPNLSELEELAGRYLRDELEIIDAARMLKTQGASNVLVSLGADGAILLDETDSVHIAKAPKIKVCDTVGAGDSMIAGFLSASELGYSEALRVSVAVGSATASVKGLATEKDIKMLH